MYSLIRPTPVPPIPSTQAVAHGMIVPVRAIFMANEVGTHLDRFFVLSDEEKIEVPLRCYGLRADIQVPRAVVSQAEIRVQSLLPTNSE